MVIILLIIIILLLLFIIKNTEKFNTNSINNIKKFKEFISNHKGKKKNILICSCGPSLNELKNFKKKIKKEFLDDCYVISIKSAINILDKNNIKTDFLLSNFFINNLNYKVLEKPNKPIVIGGNYYDKNKAHKLKKYVDYYIDIGPLGNTMKCIEENKTKCLDFRYKNNNVETGWGHVMMELAIPLCVALEPENIITIGWDITGINSHKYYKNTFKNYSKEDVILEFSSYLSNYLKNQYNINIFKLSKNQGVKIPLYKFKK